MKRLFLLVFLLLNVCTFANAQKWRIYATKGDALKGTADVIVNRTGRGGNYFICWSDSHIIKIGCSDGIFNTRSTTMLRYVDVTIGFYKGETLVDKVKVMFSVNDSYNAAYCYRRGLNRRIIEHIKTKGDVRLFAPKYTGDDYDVKLPMNPDIRFNEKKR